MATDNITETKKGWIVVNFKHPNAGNQVIDWSSFAHTRKASITAFLKGSNETWEHWSKYWNYRCVRATMILNTTSY